MQVANRTRWQTSIALGIVEALHLVWTQIFQGNVPKGGFKMVAHYDLVAVVGHWSDPWLLVVTQLSI